MAGFWRAYSGVTAFTGMPGSGKTYGLAEVAARALRRGLPVYSNEGFDLAHEGARTFCSFDEFVTVIGSTEEVVICFDELPLYFNSRKWQEFPDAVLYYLTQIRKCRARLYYSAIHEAMVDANVRRLTFWYWHCRAISGRLLRRSLFPPEEFRRARAKPYRSEFVWVKRDTAGLYDTMARVSVAPSLRAKLDAPSERWEAPGRGSGVAVASETENAG
ncbi:MAG TPA: hypothetical protein VGA20_09380 [Gemmatimonadales bacterium]